MTILLNNFHPYTFAYAWWWPFSGSVEGDIISDNLASKQLFKERIDELWACYIGSGSGVCAGTGAHPIWTITVDLAALIALIAFIWAFLGIFKKMNESENYFAELDQIIFILVIIIMLMNEGEMAADVARSLRAIAIGIDSQVSTQVSVYNSTFNSIKDEAGDRDARTFVIGATKRCSDYINEGQEEYKTCVLKEVQAEIDRAGTNANPAFLSGLQKVLTGVVDFASYVGQTSILAEDRIKLFIAGLSFSIAADMAMFLNALFVPIALAASILPVGQKAIFGWFATFWGIASTKISYTLMVALMTDILASQDGVGDLLLAWMIGKILPWIAVILGSGGGFVFFSSLSGMGLKYASGVSISESFKSMTSKG
jgi:hypothetical protein